MAKIKKTTKKRKEYRYLLIPAAIGASVAWIYSGGAFDFAFVVFVAVLIGCWVASKFVNKK